MYVPKKPTRSESRITNASMSQPALVAYRAMRMSWKSQK